MLDTHGIISYDESMNNTCDHETCDGNRDDPTYYYCDLPFAHAGDHNYVL